VSRAATRGYPPRQQLDELTVEWCGPHALIRLRHETARELQLLASLPGAAGHTLVLASTGAHGHPGLYPVAHSLLGGLADRGRPHTVWLALSDTGRVEPADAARLCAVAAELDVVVLAADGVLTGVLGSGLFVGAAGGGSGWRRFHPDRAGEVVSTRFPMPSWETALPLTPVSHAGLVAEPVPAGLAVRRRQSAPVTPDDLTFNVAADPDYPKVVVGRPGEPPIAPDALAALLATCPPEVRAGLVLVPATVEHCTPGWLAEVAGRLGAPVYTCTGVRFGGPAGIGATVLLGADGQPTRQPLATVLWQSPDGGAQEVLEIAGPPAGWERVDTTSYAPAGSGGQRGVAVLAQVVAEGLVLREQPDPAPPTGPFDPRCWTLTIGTDDAVISAAIPAALRLLLAGLTAEQLAGARVRLRGHREPVTAAALSGILREAGLRVDQGSAGPDPAVRRAAPVPVAGPVATTSVGGSPVDAPRPRAGRHARPADDDDQPADLPTAATTRPGVPPAPVRQPPVQPAPVRHAAMRAPVAEPPAMRAPVAAPPAAPGPAGRAPGQAPPVAAGPMPTIAPMPTMSGTTRAAPRPVRTDPVPIADRPSTRDEQAALAATAGSAFTDALSLVNAAMASWPTLRRDESPGAKTDYVAVCLYLGAGPAGAVRLNDSLRHDQPVLLAGLPQCVASGLRRLPTHRRPLLRQSRTVPTHSDPYPVGSVLGEPAFLSASAALDVCVPGAQLDLLIWPRTARRTAELGVHHSVDEAVFPLGTRFKALATRTAAPRPAATDGAEADRSPAATGPRIAVLLRELAPGEAAGSAESEARDLAALARLDKAWTARQKSPVRLVDDPDVVVRLTTPMVTADAEAQARQRARPAATQGGGPGRQVAR
jgi:hypothetical protein